MYQPLLKQIPRSIFIPTYTREEWQLIQTLRERYRQDHDLLTMDERARLTFVRWLVQSGRLAP